MADALSEAPTFGIAKILQDGRFVIPSHQRDYSWTTDEVQQLFDDVAEAIEKKSDSYFLGLLVFLTEAEQFTVLDGQQRLATTIIIFAAIRDWLRQYPEQHDEARKIQDTYIGGSELGEKEPTPRLILNQANNKYFLDFVIKGAAIDDVYAAMKKLKKHDPNRELLEAIIYSHTRVKDIALEIGDATKAAKYFFEIIKFFRDRIRTVRLLVADENAAYTLFETLNDRGVDLSPLDLVKNFLFQKASGLSAATLKEMQYRWVQMIATLSNVKATSFLKVYWTSRHGRIRTNLLFDTFRTQYKDAHKAVTLSVDLLTAAEQYAALDSSEDATWSPYSKDVRISIATLKLLGSQQVHPIILSAIARFDAGEMAKLLRLLEVSIVRFLLVVGGNPGRFEPACARIAEQVYKGTLKTTAAVFKEFKSADIYPSDSDFEAAFCLKSERNSQKARYFLRAIEKDAQLLAKGKMANEWEPADLTLEHVLPKKPNSDWKSVIKADKELVEDCVSRLGNLCLLTKVNKDLGSNGFDKKKKIYATSELTTTKQLENVSAWNRLSIEKRQEQMAKRAKAIWRYG